MSPATSDNLMPMARRSARESRARLRVWMAGWCVLALVGTGGIVGTYNAKDRGPRASQAEWKSVEDRFQASQARLSRLKADAARLADRRSTLEQVGTRADWSVVLSLISHRLGPGVSLTSVEIGPGAKPPAKASYAVAISGSASDQGAVASFVLALERLGVFDTVTLRQSRREGLAEGAPVAFDVVCVAEEGR